MAKKKAQGQGHGAADVQKSTSQQDIRSDISSLPDSRPATTTSPRSSKKKQKHNNNIKDKETDSNIFVMINAAVALGLVGLAVHASKDGQGINGLFKKNNNGNGNGSGTPRYAQVIRPSSFAVLDTVPSPSQHNFTTLFFPPGTDADSLKEKPFLIYDDAFYDIIGSDPTLTVIADSGTNPLFHEATVWYPPTDEVFFVQNAGAPAAGTGLDKSAIVQKISLSQAQNVVSNGGSVDVITVNTSVPVINPNGATNFRGKIVFTGEGQGEDIPPALYWVEPVEPHNATVILNNYYGRQFNSLNDVAVNPRNKQLYFTDVTYGYLQDFRPAPVLPNQVYRFDADTGALGVVADGFNLPNGVTFSPDGKYAYVADTGANAGFWGFNYTKPSTLYRFDVNDDGTWDNRMTFAYIDSGVPDGVHCDTKGNVYAGVGDGIHVWNPSGLLLGKIWLGVTSANFQFAGKGRMVICAETKLYYVTLGAEGADITSSQYSG
ncbi:hypothetical protein I302_100255 [Kwoniella bestiolae CBS 10118]|uniref:Gluconolactonase n=1 Tax=Kwoniella bestiolae CBS 10118 TaxID=1296100 RepID=A0A1B9G4M2_9TREE|nr:gluconolactonase [Kwoniella bestiolae CBS 10118]OCF25951.1 gluconolactonase [Kwoniella bestiolae CBS 10118]